MERLDRKFWWFAIRLWTLIFLVALAIFIWLMHAAKASECYGSARAFWANNPGKHAYWHNMDNGRCWDDRAGHGRHAARRIASAPRVKDISHNEERPDSNQLGRGPIPLVEPGRASSSASPIWDAFSQMREPSSWTDDEVTASERLLVWSWKRFLEDSIARAETVRGRWQQSPPPLSGETKSHVGHNTDRAP